MLVSLGFPPGAFQFWQGRILSCQPDCEEKGGVSLATGILSTYLGEDCKIADQCHQLQSTAQLLNLRKLIRLLLCVCVCLFLKIDSYAELKISEAKITLLHILNRGTGWLFVTMKQNIPDKKFLLFLKFASLDVFHTPETAGNSPAQQGEYVWIHLCMLKL